MQVPAKERQAEIEIKKSRFLAAAHPVETEAAAREILSRTRDEHPKATHVVWAYVLGDENNQLLGMSDDGEPHGTAGKPVLSILQYSGLTDILVTVVRYFGGTKLGTGGLVKAYSEAAKAVVDEMPRRRRVAETTLSLSVAYHFFDAVKRCIEERPARIESEEFSADVALRIIVEEDHAEELIDELTEITNGTVVID